ncbi:MAG: hypothetical protein J6U92_07885 [Clostridia bacterium]|nr:hypothetical protein [Clostridia bacterium]
MKKREVIEKVINKTRSEVIDGFYISQARMWATEKKLVKTFTKEQKELYDEYVKKRDLFYAIAGEIYQKKF